MKKLLVVLMVLGMASMANAMLQISVNGQLDVPDTAISLLPSQSVMIDIHGVAPETLTPIDQWLIVEGPGTVAGGVLLYGGNGSVLKGPIDGTWPPPDDVVIGWLQGLGYQTNQAYYMNFVEMTTSAPPSMLGKLVDEIILHCEGPGEVLLTLANIYDDGMGTVTITVSDTQLIHQIPEPITVALLGLGGLFLRRRK